VDIGIKEVVSGGDPYYRSYTIYSWNSEDDHPPYLSIPI